jgi:XTP/dITP diphosphohydrolase
VTAARAVDRNPAPLRFVLATANPDKAEEIRQILAAVPGLELVPRPPDVPEVDETGATLLDNARLKARALVAATGLPALADDTGLEVAALDGAPGVHTARFAGPDASDADNVTRLLDALRDVARPDRHARFVTAVVALWPDGREEAAAGSVRGRITEVRRGDGGFGYDPVFAPDGGGGRTFAEMTAGEKHAVSHRARAFHALAARLTA